MSATTHTLTALTGLMMTAVVGLNAITPKTQAEEASRDQIQVEYIKQVPVVYTNSDVYQILNDFKSKERPVFETSFVEEEVFYLAATMWGEARGEGARGMGMVGHVIMNRVEAEYRGNTVKSVVLSRKQFSCWNKNDPNRVKLTREYLNNTTGVEAETWREAQRLAKAIYRGTRDYTGGALHYHSNEVKPFWQKAYDVTLKAGNHIFYK